jgi:cell division protein FtsX
VVRMVQEGLPLIEFIQFRAGHEIYVVLFPFVIFLGALIGSIGSGMAIRRHLKV